MSAAKQLVPELRFPEFIGDGEWKTFNGNKLFAQINDRDHNGDLPVLAITQEYGAIPRDLIDYNVSVSQSSIDSYKIVRVGDFIISLRSFQGGIEFSNYEGLCSPAYVILREKGGTVTAFFKQFFKSKSFIRELTKNLEGLRDGKMISYKQFSDVLINTPSEAEQKKIADCLGSLDDLIAAHSRKLDALQDHKKGLLQQLFPAEGQTTPKLRFPEFRNTGEWVKKRFSDLCDIKHGYAFESKFFNNEGDYVLLTPGNFYEQGGYRDRGEKQKYYTGEIPREYVLNFGDLLVAMTEQAAGLLGSPILVPESDRFLHNQRLGLVIQKPGVVWTNEFFFYTFNSHPVRVAISGSASGAKVRHTSPIKIGEAFVSVPASLPEQQKIADCLSDLDALITAQTEQIAALKEHKKGLMQKLFPTTN